MSFNEQGQTSSKDEQLTKQIEEFQYLGSWLNGTKDIEMQYMWQKHGQDKTKYLQHGSLCL